MENGEKKSNTFSGERVSKLRKRHNWTQEQLAEALDVEPNYISMIETGRRKLPVKRAKQIALLFPPLRYQYLLCEDDFETEEALFRSLRDNRREQYEKFKSSNDLILQVVNNISSKLQRKISFAASIDMPSPNCDYLQIEDADENTEDTDKNTKIVESDIIFRILRYAEYETFMLLRGSDNG